jgi:short-subunit dehydrogenase
MKPRLKPISEQVMLVTGASSGIGLATALAAAAKGASLALVARSGDTLEDVAATINLSGGKAIALVADVANRNALEEAAAATVKRFGGIDTWVNNAGVSIYGRIEEVSDADNRRLFETNFWGVVNGSLVALPHLRMRGGGALINLGSEASEAALPLQGIYAASKHAVKGFTDALRIEVEQLDDAPIAIVLIQPTAVDTPYPQHARNYMNREPQLPSPMIEPERVAAAILDAASAGGRDVKVGAMAFADTAMSKLTPHLFDRLAARQAARQKRKRPPEHPGGTLYEPSEDGRVHGRGT